MNSTYKDWREYQNAVANFFRDRSCTVKVGAEIEGARGTHEIDVYVTFTQHGIECRWAIECKLWKDKVKKRNVMEWELYTILTKFRDSTLRSRAASLGIPTRCLL